jgi:hypothetical protein
MLLDKDICVILLLIAYLLSPPLLYPQVKFFSLKYILKIIFQIFRIKFNFYILYIK